MGGANVISYIQGKRLGTDNNKYLIALLNALQKGWIPPINISKTEYNKIKKNKNNFPPELVGYCGLIISYSNIWFGGYTGNLTSHNLPKGTYLIEGNLNCITFAPLLKDIIFATKDYRKLKLPKNSLVYCDPPYKDTIDYQSSKFDHKEFWEWCRDKIKQGHTLLISEYEAPKDFKCIFEKKLNTNMRTKNKSRIEKVFICQQ